MHHPPNSVTLPEDEDEGTDTEARVEEILTSLHEREDIQIESSYSDRKESTLVNTFFVDGCRCKLNCHVSIGREAIERHRGNCAELSKLELDMAILG